MILTIIDTTGIQDYIFNTNKLRRIVGASYLVNCASRDWVKEEIEKAGFSHNILNLDGETPEEVFDLSKRIENGNVDAEVIYAGGGNTLILFTDLEHAEAFTQKLTRRVLIDAPGLRLVIAHQPFDWKNDALGGGGGVLEKAFGVLAHRKAASVPITSEPGLGVTVECAFTALPAISEASGRPISAEVMAKLGAEDTGHERLMNLVSFQGYLDPPRELDELGQSEGEKSLLAVVHTDGNAMGSRMDKIRELYTTPAGNRDCVNAQRAFSLSIQFAAIQALQKTIDVLIDNEKDGKIGGKIEISHERLPFRPIIFGGDDLTFVCDGRLGLSLAAIYLRAAAEQPLSDGAPLFCRAGVAVVKVNYPIARAYDLAEELCGSAKKFITEKETSLESALRDEILGRTVQKFHLAVMDWHFSTTSLLDELGEIREREYTANTGPLTMRPISVIEKIEISGQDPAPKLDSDWRNWDTFLQIVNEFLNGDDWGGKHNKVKALRLALRGGKASVRQFCTNFSVKLPTFSGVTQDGGWVGNNCAYFDAIEAMDVLVQLKEEGQQ